MQGRGPRRGYSHDLLDSRTVGEPEGCQQVQEGVGGRRTAARMHSASEHRPLSTGLWGTLWLPVALLPWLLTAPPHRAT